MSLKRREQPLQRFVDAHPRWSSDAHDLIVFDCPIHEECTIHVPIAPRRKPGWDAHGSTFAALTLSPSIKRMGPSCYWHGFVRDGSFETLDDSR